MMLLSLNPSSYYYKSHKDVTDDLEIQRAIDKIYTKYPFYGTRRIVFTLKKQGININRKKCRRLMREMGICAIYPRKNLSKSDKDHKKYPYLLRDKKISRPNEVWCSDITYIPMAKGFAYLVVVMDWYSRKILSYELSDTLESDFCVKALNTALRNGEKNGIRPKIFNTDQGSQFTSEKYTTVLLNKGIKISMDGRGRAFDNIMVERFWRTIKYEDIYIKDYSSMDELVLGVGKYIKFYNQERPHSTFDGDVPSYVYINKRAA
jgi:putative transposase